MTTLSSRPPEPLTYQFLELLIDRHPELAGKPITRVLFTPPFIEVGFLDHGIEVVALIEDLI